MDQWRSAHEELLKEFRWEIFISNISHSFLEAPHIVPEFWRQVFLFYNAVNWREPFFTYLGAFHIFVYTVALFVCFVWRDYELVLLAASSTLVMFSCSVFFWLGWLHRHASWFFSENVNYFDEAGLFVAVVFWLPLISCAVGMQFFLFCRLIHAVRLMKTSGPRIGVGESQSSKLVGEKSKAMPYLEEMEVPLSKPFSDTLPSGGSSSPRITKSKSEWCS